MTSASLSSFRTMPGFPVVEGAKLEHGEIRARGGLDGRVAVITGASGGIGRALSVGLALRGAQICAIGRNPSGLAETVAEVRPLSAIKEFQIDLTTDENFESLTSHLAGTGRLDILIHSAGVIHEGRMEEASIEEFDLQYAANVRAPYLLTQRLLPLLTASRGQVVFINSSAGLSARRPEAGQYAATKHALRAIADSLREEVNSKGVRVLSVYLGRTATAMQESLFRKAGRTYKPEVLLQAEDIASVVVQMLMLPPTAEVTDISIRPMYKSY